MMLQKEIERIVELMEVLTNDFNPISGSPIAVDCKLIDCNGEVVGEVKIDGGEEYEFLPRR